MQLKGEMWNKINSNVDCFSTVIVFLHCWVVHNFVIEWEITKQKWSFPLMQISLIDFISLVNVNKLLVDLLKTFSMEYVILSAVLWDLVTASIKAKSGYLNVRFFVVISHYWSILFPFFLKEKQMFFLRD